jgi:hypothetical protein
VPMSPNTTPTAPSVSAAMPVFAAIRREGLGSGSGSVFSGAGGAAGTLRR